MFMICMKILSVTGSIPHQFVLYMYIIAMQLLFYITVYINEEVTATGTIIQIEKRVVTFDINCEVKDTKKVMQP